MCLRGKPGVQNAEKAENEIDYLRLTVPLYCCYTTVKVDPIKKGCIT